MGCALRQDMQNPDKGVVIEKGDGEVPGDASTGLDAALTGQARNLSPGAALPGAVPDPMVSAPPAGAAPPSSFSPPPVHGVAVPAQDHGVCAAAPHPVRVCRRVGAVVRAR